MKPLLLSLVVLGATVPFVALAPWLAEHGLDLPLLVEQMFATEVSSFFSLDVLVSALAVFVMVGRGVRRGVPHAWLAAVGTVVVGVSLGLPLYLYLETRHEQAGG